MLTVVDKPQIQYVVEECVVSGIEHIIIVTGKGKNSIEDHFDYSPTLERFLEEKGKKEQAAMVRHISDMVQVSYTRQKEPLGLGHAVLVARDLVGDEPFAVLLGDVLIPGPNPATKQLIDVYAATGVGAIAVEEVPKERTHLYGIIGGSTFGHEITHGFDDQGSLYDENGNLNNWWSSADSARFFSKTTGWCPSKASSAAQLRPAGPPPMMATRLPDLAAGALRT